MTRASKAPPFPEDLSKYVEKRFGESKSIYSLDSLNSWPRITTVNVPRAILERGKSFVKFLRRLSSS